MKEIEGLASLIDIYSIDCSFQGELASIAANLKAMIKFESQRVMIQEMT